MYLKLSKKGMKTISCKFDMRRRIVNSEMYPTCAVGFVCNIENYGHWQAVMLQTFWVTSLGWRWELVSRGWR